MSSSYAFKLFSSQIIFKSENFLVLLYSINIVFFLLFRVLAEKLKINARKAALKDPDHPLVKLSEETVEKIAKELDTSEAKVIITYN